MSLRALLIIILVCLAFLVLWKATGPHGIA
jgi:hypothetical protein